MLKLITEHFGEVLRVPETHSGPNSACHRQTLPPQVFLLRRLRQKPGRHTVHGRRDQPCALHRGLPQDFRPKVLGVQAAHNARAWRGGDGASRRLGSQFSYPVLQV